MRVSRWIPWTLGLVLAALGSAHGAGAEKAPAGLRWENLTEIHARVLRPEKWFVKREIKPGSNGYFFSRENIEGGGEFKVGLSFYALPKISASTSKPADESAAAMLDEIASKGKVLKRWTAKGDPCTTHGLLYTVKGPNGAETTIKNLYLANPKTDTLYLLILESPSADWKAIDKIGETIFANLRLDAAY